jgi:hypothetical protein
MREPWLRREANMMGIYVSIVLFGALTLGNDHGRHEQIDVLEVVWGTTLGLALAHWFAHTLAEKLENEPSEHPLGWLLYAQTVMAFAVALCATVTVLVLPADLERVGARFTASLFVGVLVYRAKRLGGASRLASFLTGLVALVLEIVVSLIKWTIGH